MDMTQLFAAFPQLSMMGGQQPMQTGTPQMNGGMNFQALTTDPNAASNLQADAIQLKNKMDMARALMQQGGEYIPGSGKAGIAAGLASLIRGKMMASGQDESMRDILARQFDQDSKAAQAKRAQELEDEDRHLRQKIYGEGESAKAKAKAEKEFAKAEFTGGGVFDPATGQFAPSQEWMGQQTALEQMKARIAAGNRQGPADPFGKYKQAVAAGIMSPEEMNAAIKRELTGGSGGNAPAGYRSSADGSSLEAIPGGPADTSKPRQVPADMAGKVALADEYVQNFPNIEQSIQKGDLTGVVDVATAKLGYGKQGEGYRQIQAGRDALQRTLTGAGMPASEAAEYTQRYLPTATDTQETLLSKQRQLKKELENFTNIARGTSNGTAPITQQGKEALSDADLLKKYGG